MSRIHEALQKARKQPLGSAQQFPDVDDVIAAKGAASDEPQAPSLSFTAPLEALSALDEFEPILANCAKHNWPAVGKNMIFLSDEADVTGQEQFRTLRSRLYQMRAGGELKVIVVSSALPEEGKSFVSANLAHSFALQTGRRVLVIDADTRRAGGLSSLLEAPSTPGLTEYLLGEKRVDEIVQLGSIDRLYYIPCGRRVAKPGELIGDSSFGALIEQLRPSFDWIVIDTPPVLPISDARVIADLSDGVLMVVNSTATLSRLAKRASQEFRRESILGVVLNRTSDPSATRYSAYGYGYGIQSADHISREPSA
jgi:capsular exopolysaccharide synthesis family protein